ncbi:MAG: hypothetical protein WA019_04095 [Candidatus Moraniibacteriota bacterium]
MVIYTLTDDVNGIKKGSKLVFNKSQQRFEAMRDKDQYISNFAPFCELLKIKIHRVLTTASEQKRVIVIPF